MNRLVNTLTGSHFLQSAALMWVGGSAAIGGILSGTRKLALIANEPQPVFKNELIEHPIRCVYNTSRVAAHVGLGGFLAGFVALTAPVSIPMYCYWRSETHARKHPTSGTPQ